MFFFVKRFPLDGDTVEICTLIWPATRLRVSYLFTIPSVLLLFVLPLVVIVFNYWRILRILLGSRRRVGRAHVTSSDTPQCIRSAILKSWSDRKSLRLVRILVVLVVVFFVTFLPIVVCFCLILRDGVTGQKSMTSQLFLAGTCFSFAGSCVNPFIYGAATDGYSGCMASFRERYWRRWQANRRRVQPNVFALRVNYPNACVNAKEATPE